MYAIRYIGKFKKDFKVVQKRKYDVESLKSAIAALANNEELPTSYETHKLIR